MAHSRMNRVDYAIKFFVSRSAFEQERALYGGSSPLGQFLPQVPAPPVHLWPRLCSLHTGETHMNCFVLLLTMVTVTIRLGGPDPRQSRVSVFCALGQVVTCTYSSTYDQP